MRKKDFWLIILVVLFMITTVKAESKLNLDCGDNKVSEGETLSCNLSLQYQEERFSSIEFNYENVSGFEKVGNVSLYNNNGKITITNIEVSDTSQSVNLAKVKVSGDNNKKISLTNIKMTDSAESVVTSADIVRDIEVTKAEVVDSKLKTITIDGVEISGFSPNKYSYLNITVNKTIVSIDAVSNNKNTIITGLGQVFLRPNVTTTQHIVVTPNDGEAITYTLLLTYVPASKDNNLKSLEIYHGNNKIDFSFDDSKTSFDVKIDDGSIDKVNIKAEPNDNKATFIEKYAPREVKLSYGKNTFEIRVKAESGEIKVYTLNITRTDNRSNDTSLKSLTINDEEIVLTKTDTKYEITLASDIDKTKINAVANDSKAKVEYKDITLKTGNNNVTIKVTAENGTSKQYQIVVIREEEKEIPQETEEEKEEEKTLLENITVNGYDLNFDVNKMTYDLTIKEDTNKLDIIVTPTEKIETTILGNGNLVNNSTIIIRVTDSEGVKSYTINIHKEKGNNILNILCISTFIIGIIAFISSIIYAIKKKK